MKTNTISVFYSYSHKDESLRDSLETHLSILSRKGIVSSWHDRRILPGCEWEKEIDENIRTADLILLLVSPDFIASDYCFGKELSIAIENHESKKSMVIPVIIRPVDWEDAPFAKLQALPTDALPVTNWTNQDQAWLDIAQGIKKAVKELAKQKNRDGEHAGLLSMRDVLTKEVDRMEAIFESLDDRECSGLSTGLIELDHVIDGLHSSQLLVIASRPLMGKTNLAIGLAAHVAITEKLPVAYFSMSISTDQLTRRLIASVGHVNIHNLLRGLVEDDEWPRITAAINILVEAPLYIDESTVSSVEQLRARTLKLKSTHDLKLIVIDSLQHLVFHGKQSQETSSNNDYSKALKHLAKELQIPIVITTSLPRNIESRPNKRPMIQDLFGESKGIESDSDVVLFIYRDEIYNYDSIDRGLAELIIAKNNNGPVCTIRTLYLEEISKFGSLSIDP